MITHDKSDVPATIRESSPKANVFGKRLTQVSNDTNQSQYFLSVHYQLSLK